VTLTL